MSKKIEILINPDKGRSHTARENDEYVISDARDRRHVRVTMVDPFSAACIRGAFTPAQANAGAKFRHHWERGGLRGQISTIDLNRVFGGGDHSRFAGTEDEAHHRLQYRNAITTLKGEAPLVQWVVCEEYTMEAAGRALGWKNKPQAISAAVERLKPALELLKELWGL